MNFDAAKKEFLWELGIAVWISCDSHLMGMRRLQSVFPRAKAQGWSTCTARKKLSGSKETLVSPVKKNLR